MQKSAQQNSNRFEWKLIGFMLAPGGLHRARLDGSTGWRRSATD
jgi:hypothetical protein